MGRNMTPDPLGTPSYASPPFDSPKADLILRLSGFVNFRVSSFILEMASDVFSSMLEACQASSGDNRDDPPLSNYNRLVRPSTPFSAPYILGRLPHLTTSQPFLPSYMRQSNMTWRRQLKSPAGLCRHSHRNCLFVYGASRSDADSNPRLEQPQTK
ncbi:hypothetical protein C8Q72DRAFT_138556 [Fomitopsis betulina]|nr:hypothetical protein C8Q72DRAFT_138556 [Fomitopsis betulina]